MSTHHVEIELGGQTLRCTCDYSPSTPDVMYLPNGDPGFPGDPEEFSVTRVELDIEASRTACAWLDVTDLVYELSSDEGERINDLAYAQLQSDFEAGREADSEARAEARDEAEFNDRIWSRT